MAEPRMSRQTLQVLSCMLDDPLTPWFGLELTRAAKLKSGTIYPILARLEHAGWLESRWEAEDASSLGRPRRRLYRLTGLGEGRARAELDAHVRALTRPSVSHRARLGGVAIP